MKLIVQLVNNMKKVLILLLLLTTSVYAQNYEVYTGAVISEDRDMMVGYELGANFIIKTNQDRKYLNNLLLGFSHQGFMSDNMKYKVLGNDLTETEVDCNCIAENIEFNNSSEYTLKKMVRAVTLNMGVEISNRWYLISGVTNLQHISLINGEKVSEYRTMQINAGVKYFIKTNRWMFSPTIMFNPETISFGVGISYQ